MLNNDLFQKFCRERNIAESTQRSYESALKHYLKFNNQNLKDILSEAIADEEKKIPLKDRRIKKRLINYRNHLLKSKCTPNTMRTYFSKIKTFYTHFDIEIPPLPETKYHKTYQTSYLNLPGKEHIRKACDTSTLDMKAIILFMSSSGTSKSETLSITIDQFIQSTSTYHNGGSIKHIQKPYRLKKTSYPHST